FSVVPPPQTSALFPYTTLFRSFCVGLNGGVSCGSSYPVGFGWSLLLYSDRIPKAGGFLLSAGWLAALVAPVAFWARRRWEAALADRKSTRLNSSHVKSSYAVFC